MIKRRCCQLLQPFNVCMQLIYYITLISYVEICNAILIIFHLTIYITYFLLSQYNFLKWNNKYAYIKLIYQQVHTNKIEMNICVSK